VGNIFNYVEVVAIAVIVCGVVACVALVLCKSRQRWPPHKKIAHRDIWAVPSLSAEIEYRGKSAKGKVRHPFWCWVCPVRDFGQRASCKVR
jgi:hypothetical protein